jgi:hypothetical protein
VGTLLSTFLESRSWLWKIIIIIIKNQNRGAQSKSTISLGNLTMSLEKIWLWNLYLP